MQKQREDPEIHRQCWDKHRIETDTGFKGFSRHTSTIEGKSAYPKDKILFFSKIQLVVYYLYCILIGWATTRLYVIVH